MDDLTEKVNSILEYEIKVIENQFRKNGINIVYGEASFQDSKSISVKYSGGKESEMFWPMGPIGRPKRLVTARKTMLIIISRNMSSCL